MNLIDKYKEWCEGGYLEQYGLCPTLLHSKYFKTLKQFEPEPPERLLFWAFGENYNAPFVERSRKLTPLRETIVLLICAMHNEL